MFVAGRDWGMPEHFYNQVRKGLDGMRCYGIEWCLFLGHLMITWLLMLSPDPLPCIDWLKNMHNLLTNVPFLQVSGFPFVSSSSLKINMVVTIDEIQKIVGIIFDWLFHLLACSPFETMPPNLAFCYKAREPNPTVVMHFLASKHYLWCE